MSPDPTEQVLEAAETPVNDVDASKTPTYNEALFSPTTRTLLGEYEALDTDADSTIGERLDARALQLQQEILAIRCRRNGLSKINRLPPEILSQIFLVHRKQTKRLYMREDASWIRVTHVCRQWREVALGCAALWTDIDFPTPDFAKIMLERSRNMPLSISFLNRRISTIPALRDVLSNHASRIRFLNMECEETRLNPVGAFKNLAKDAPLLEKLIVSAPKDGICFWPAFESAPKLKHLELQHLVMQWDRLPLVAGLTELRIETPIWRRHVRGGHSVAQPDALLESLEQFQELRSLKLHGILPGDGFASLPRSTDRTVSLGSLKELDIGDFAAGVKDFFNAIRIPKTTTISVTFFELMAPTAAIQQSLASVEASWGDDPCVWKKKGIVSMNIVESDRDSETTCTRFELEFALPDDIAPDVDDKPHLAVSLTTYTSPLRYPQPHWALLAEANVRFDLSPLTYLELSTKAIPMSLLLSSFGGLPKLETISFCNSSPHDLFTLMSDDEPPPRRTTRASAQKDAQRVVSFPALQEITMYDIVFDPCSDEVGLLIRAFKNRAEAHRIRTLQIDQCFNFTEYHAARIRTALADLPPEDLDFAWDGNVMFYDEDEDDEEDSEDGDGWF